MPGLLSMAALRFMTRPRRYAYFISPHGYGHAARASAVMAAILELDAESEFDIYTLVPRWFFEDSVGDHFSYFPLLTDIGLVQETPLKADLRLTRDRLNRHLPFRASKIEKLAARLVKRRCSLALCDISPLGIAAAREAGIPSVLIENFTWNWIYEAYLGEACGPAEFIPYLKTIFDMADLHIQTEPVCFPRPSHLRTSPVGRKPRQSPVEIRRALQIAEDEKMVLITMGGLPMQFSFLPDLAGFSKISFVFPGISEKVFFQGNLRLLPRRSGFYHPDLVWAADLVVGKVGYSTLAEVYGSGTPFGYIARPAFRESEPLVAFIKAHMNGLSIEETAFRSGEWVSCLPELLSFSRKKPRTPEGARQIADFLTTLPERSARSGGAKHHIPPVDL